MPGRAIQAANLDPGTQATAKSPSTDIIRRHPRKDPGITRATRALARGMFCGGRLQLWTGVPDHSVNRFSRGCGFPVFNVGSVSWGPLDRTGTLSTATVGPPANQWRGFASALMYSTPMRLHCSLMSFSISVGEQTMLVS
jgi:hypothetical protein